jgi:D-sedoheptulose 7-phosphate isomerase
MIDFDKQITEHLEVIQGIRPLASLLTEVAQLMSGCLAAGGKIIWMGNGGSAADSQHLAAEFVCRFSRERQGLASIALTTDSSILTAVSNDFGFEWVFSRQIEALCSPGDIVVGISTSGNSANVINALREARARRAMTVGFGGGDGGAMRGEVDHCLLVPSSVTARIQEAHILMGHLLCDSVEAAFANG